VHSYALTDKQDGELVDVTSALREMEVFAIPLAEKRYLQSGRVVSKLGQERGEYSMMITLKGRANADAKS